MKYRAATRWPQDTPPFSFGAIHVTGDSMEREFDHLAARLRRSRGDTHQTATHTKPRVASQTDCFVTCLVYPCSVIRKLANHVKAAQTVSGPPLGARQRQLRHSVEAVISKLLKEGGLKLLRCYAGESLQPPPFSLAAMSGSRGAHSVLTRCRVTHTRCSTSH